MKKALTAAAVILSAITFAQTTASTTVNIKLNPIMSIAVNQPTVNIEYLTEADYIGGKSVTIPNHLTTFSTQGYVVSAKTTATNIASPTDSMDLEALTITANSNFPLAVYTPAVLSTAGAPLIDSPVGAGRKQHNVTYAVSGDFWDKAMETYSVNAIYTITAQ